MIRAVLLITVWTLSMLFLPDASASDFEVGNINLSSTNWGMQTASINLTNLSEDYRLVVALAEVAYPEGNIESTRQSRKNFIILTPDTVSLELPFVIHGNIGNGVVTVSLFDVVDTLDQLLESQKFYSEEFPFNITISESLKPIIDSGIYVPYFVDKSEIFDNLFSRMLLLLLHREVSAEEIARLAKTDPDYVSLEADRLMQEYYVEKSGPDYKSRVSVIEADQLKVLWPVMKKTVDGLYNVIKRNLPGYDSTVRALAQQGLVTSDANDLADGSSVLYHKYPVVLGLLLWDLLGTDFINNGQIFATFRDSDPCRAAMGDYMYLIVGPEKNAGRTFYFRMMDNEDVPRFYCGFNIPEIRCNERGWTFKKEQAPTYYIYDEEKIRMPLSILMDGSTEYTAELKRKLAEVFEKDQDRSYIHGARYWCWNVLVGDLMEKLEKTNVLAREGSGNFLMQEVE
jgi:hypothetical protein